MITSMTPAERANPKLIDGSQADRGGLGHHRPGGLPSSIKQFAQMQKMMRQLQKGKMPSLQQLAGGG